MTRFLISSHHIHNLNCFSDVNRWTLLTFKSFGSKSCKNLLNSAIDISSPRLLSKSRRGRIRIFNSILNILKVSLERWMNASWISSPFLIHLIKIDRRTSICKVFSMIRFLQYSWLFIKASCNGLMHRWRKSWNSRVASLLYVSWQEHFISIN